MMRCYNTKIITHYDMKFCNLNIFYIYSYYSQSITVTKPNASRLLSFTARVGTTAPVTSVMYLSSCNEKLQQSAPCQDCVLWTPRQSCENGP